MYSDLVLQGRLYLLDWAVQHRPQWANRSPATYITFADCAVVLGKHSNVRRQWLLEECSLLDEERVS